MSAKPQPLASTPELSTPLSCENSPAVEVEIGDRAIWVNAATGECIGRFGVYGVDVHRPIADQHMGQCLDCTHARVTSADWTRFQQSMLLHHDVDLSGVAMPDFVA